MKDYNLFEVNDFIEDERFIKWVTMPDEQSDRFWSEWLLRNPGKRETMEKARHFITHISFNERWSDAERQAMWRHISEGLRVDETVKPVVSLHRRHLFRNWWYAASVVFLIGLGWYFAATSDANVRTGFGEVREVTLADGTRITLNANSRLVYKRNFLKSGTRNVRISGEAFFNVAPYSAGGKKVPFVVHANQLDVQVLGTAFNVNTRRGRVDVALEHGLVKVVDAGNSDNTLFLKPGEKVTQLSDGTLLQKQTVAISDYTGWKEKVIQYRNKSLEEIAEMMGDIYGIDVVFENKALKQEIFTGVFPADSATVFFDKLEKLHPVKIRRQGNRFYLK